MKKRRLLWAEPLQLALLAAAGVGWLLVAPDPASQVKPGMKLDEVTTIFGRPGKAKLMAQTTHSKTAWYAWNQGSRSVWVEFGADGWVDTDAQLAATGAVDTKGVWSPLDRLRAWLGW